MTWETFFDVLLDALLDTAKLIPFLFAAYLLLEYLEHKASASLSRFLSEGKYGVPGGAVLGCIPQCGMGVAAAHMFSGGVISAGTLIAVFVSTSDEAIPVIVANFDKAAAIIPLILGKVAFAVVCGYLYQLILGKVKFTRKHDHCAHNCDECEKIEECREHHCEKECEHNVFVEALKRSASVLGFILAVNVAFGLLIALVGEDSLSAFLAGNKLLQPLLACLVGLIPNCASSVVITELYIAGGLSFGAAFAGLCVGAGVGYAALFRANKNIRENLLIVGFTFVMSVLAGMLIQLVM